MIRRRVVLALTVLVGLIILIMAYSGIDSSRDNMLRLITQQGLSTMQSLVTSAGNNLAASAIVEEAGAQRLSEIVTLLARLIDNNPRFVDSLDSWERRYDLERIDVISQDGNIMFSSWPEEIGDVFSGDTARVAVLDSVQSGALDIAVAAPLPSALPQEELVHVAARIRQGTLIVDAQARRLTDYQESLGIGYVVRQMGGQDAINFVVLQTDSGIVLASRSIAPMIAIEEDSFLVSALSHEEPVTRLYEFEGEEVLEVVRSFKSDVMPSGLLRIGMSLRVYHQLYYDSLKQLGILSLVLFALGIVGAWATTSIRKLQVTEGSLEQLRSMTDEIIQSLEASVVATDKQGILTVVNPLAERIFGKSAKAAVGQPYRDLFPNDELSLDRIRKDPSSVYRGEIGYSRNSNEKLSLLVSSSPLYDSRGNYNGSVSLVYDLTETKRLEENARAADRLSELGTLAAGVAHEIRNPLNSIAIAAQRLQIEFSPSENAEEYRAFLKTIGDEIQRLNAIIKDFLSLARSGQMNKVLVDLGSYFAEIVTLARLEIDKRGIAITQNIEPGLTAQIDKNEMKKVILNLVQNAMQAIDRDGTIALSASRNSDKQVQIEIMNSGLPIPRDDRAKIFHPYFTTRPEGTGLGLAICRRIVTDHGGTLELLDGEPTTFRIVV